MRRLSAAVAGGSSWRLCLAGLDGAATAAVGRSFSSCPVSHIRSRATETFGSDRRRFAAVTATGDRRRAPHTVLGVSPRASQSVVKARFRELAKVHHPDAQPREEVTQLASAAKMAELIEAYDALMDDDMAARVQASAVASSCAAFTLEELVAGGLHDVYTLRLIDEGSLLEAPPTAASPSSTSSASSPVGGPMPGSADCTGGVAAFGNSELLAVSGADGAPVGGTAVPFLASLDDSALDLKRALEKSHGQHWDLERRPRDRQGVAACWELVFRDSVLSYHLFLRDYGLEHGDVLHAVVRRREAA
mmetsp:Transcript_171307/g.549157  ORF Transcript_171307/g.549157 Transcript_171307/m.549157 type:complete len:305 (-) Transcript_171307:119-1033(-)